MRGTHWWAWLLVAACGGGSEVAPDAGDTVAPHVVTVEIVGDGDLFLAYRDGVGPWQTPEEVSDGFFELRVTYDFVLVSVCESELYSDASASARTWSDGDEMTVYCGSDEPVPTVDVTGHMVQPGSVQLDYEVVESETGPWDFSLSVRPGTYDLYALTSDRLLLRRGVSIAAAGSVPDLDVVQDGFPLESQPVAVLGLDGDETISTELLWLTTYDLFSLQSSSSEIVKPPSALLDPNDFQVVFISAGTATTFRQGFTVFTGVETLFTMPPKLTGIEYIEEDGGLSASWSTLPPDSPASMYLDASDGARDVYQRVNATADWISATGAEALGFPDDVPDYDPSWIVDLEGPYTRQFAVSEYVDGVSYRSWAIEAVNGATATQARTESYGTSLVEIAPPPRRQPSRRSHQRGLAIGIGSSGSSHGGHSSTSASDQPSNSAPDENGSVGQR